MTTVYNPSKGSSQTILSVPLWYYANPTSCEYLTSGNAKWKLVVSWKNGSISCNALSLTLYCNRKSSSDTMLAVYGVHLVSTNNPHTRNVYHQGHATFSGPTLETTAIIDLNVDSRLRQSINTHITFVQMHITIPESTAEDIEIHEEAFSSVDKAQLFSESSLFPSDSVILFKDWKKVHVNKAFLSMHSEYWKDTFAKTRDGKTLSLNNVDYNEFIDFLGVIYPTLHPITAKNVKTLAKLAYEFEMPHLLKRCDIFLTTNSAKFGQNTLLLLAQDYNLERLQKQCISEYKSIDDVKVIQNEPEYAYLNYRTKRLLLDKILGTDSSALSEASLPETSQTSCNLLTKKMRVAKMLDKLASLSTCPMDIVLVVGNNRIPAHKQFLTFFSDFFNNMFQIGFKESHESEITLEEVCYEEVVELLSVTYPSCYPINETNIATIVKLADRFMMPLILERCKKELKNSNKIRGSLKMWLAQQYGTLAELQEEFAGKCNSIEDVQKLRSEPEFRLLDDKMRAMILESITK